MRADRVLGALLIGVLALWSAGVRADAVEDFYKGRTLSVYIASGPGGGYDAYGRLLARHLANHIPGTPHLIIENMPGASGLTGTNWMYNVAPKDGTVMGSTYNTLLTEPLFGNTRARYDPLKFEWIGSITTQYNSCTVWHTSPIKTIEDAMKTEVKVSTTGMTGNSAETPLMLNMLIGTKFKLIAGYTTTGMRLAVEQGEVDGICGFSYDTYAISDPDWLQNNKIRFILQTGNKPVKELPDVPLLINYVKDPKELAALKVLNVNEELGRPFMMPPGVPKYLVTAVRRAFDETMQDPKFVADIGRMHIDPDPLTGEQMEAALKEAYGAPKDVVAEAARLWPPTTD